MEDQVPVEDPWVVEEVVAVEEVSSPEVVPLDRRLPQPGLLPGLRSQHHSLVVCLVAVVA